MCNDDKCCGGTCASTDDTPTPEEETTPETPETPTE